MARSIDVNSKFNFSQAVVLILDRSTHTADVLVQILSGFGVHNFHRCQTAKRAMEVLTGTNVDLVIVDPELEDEDGYEFIRGLRRSKCDNRCAPVVMVSGHARVTNIKRARDTGANFFVAKPLTPSVLIERIHWIAADKRQFVEVEGLYVGPDRRFKFEGPPIGSEGRRSDDLPLEVGDAEGVNMSQNEINALLKPQKVTI